MRWGSAKRWPSGRSRPAGRFRLGISRAGPTRCLRYGDQKTVSVQELARANEKQLRKVTWREGRRGKRASRFGATRVQTAPDWNHGQAPGKEVWLLLEGSAGETEPVKDYLCDLPKDCSLPRLIATARARWRVEQDYQQRKEELGLDHCEGRSGTGWHHPVTMGMRAHLFLRLEQKRRASKSTLDAAANPA
jgi:SRSO17 transposase